MKLLGYTSLRIRDGTRLEIFNSVVFFHFKYFFLVHSAEVMCNETGFMILSRKKKLEIISPFLVLRTFSVGVFSSFLRTRQGKR